jgi:anaerobic selenocysteine-containing dehydrogenase
LLKSDRLLAAGDQALVSSETGSIVLPVEITGDIMPGVVSAPHGWGHDREGIRQSVASHHAGASLNDVLRDQQVDELCGTSVLNGQPVGVKVYQPGKTRKRA